ncbi:LysR family transcriptional regulator, partial [Halomonas sp.]
MKIKEIEAFDAFMKHGTTKAAAEMLGISQSMVSRLLTGLEEALGLVVFRILCHFYPKRKEVM